MRKLNLGPIPGRRTRLRLLEESDLETTLAWRNKDRVRFYFNVSDQLTMQAHRNWFQRYSANPCDYVFVIEELDAPHRRLGQISVYNIDWSRREAEYGRLFIGEDDCLGAGFASEASRVLMDYFHSCHSIERFHLAVKKGNVRARALYQRLGFGEVGATEHLVSMRFTMKPNRG